MAWEGLDRRKFPRVIYPCLVKVVLGGGVATAWSASSKVNKKTESDAILTHTENVGEGGVCVTVKREIKLFTPVDLEIDLLDIDDHIYAKGKVAWSVHRKSIETVKPLFYDIGIQFEAMSDRDHLRLKETLKRLVSRGAKQMDPYI